jgi:quercetin dioxygenase-like cupin family protein
MILRKWDEIQKEDLSPLVGRQTLHGETMTVARFHLKKGAVVPTHSHANEQITMVQQGRMRFVIDGKEIVAEGGQLLQIPPNAPHMAEAIEDTIAVDVFSPVRADWLRGDDAYLRK